MIDIIKVLFGYFILGIKNLLGKPVEAPEQAEIAPSSPIISPVAIQPPEPPTIAELVAKNDKNLWIQMCRDIAKKYLLDSEMTAELLATIECESGFNNSLIHPNMVEGKVSTTDYYLCQINDYWHIGKGKDFPSTQYVQTHPDEVVSWMCRMFKAGRANLWICYKGNYYKKYLRNYV